MSPDQINDLAVEIQSTLKEIDDYVPILGPFLEFQRIDMKKITHMMVTHRVGMKPVDIVRSTDLRWRTITPSMSHIYNAGKNFCNFRKQNQKFGQKLLFSINRNL